MKKKLQGYCMPHFPPHRLPATITVCGWVVSNWHLKCLANHDENAANSECHTGLRCGQSRLCAGDRSRSIDAIAISRWDWCVAMARPRDQGEIDGSELLMLKFGHYLPRDAARLTHGRTFLTLCGETQHENARKQKFHSGGAIGPQTVATSSSPPWLI